ncbi:cyclic dof factor 1-like [Phragmites australis]|uniref:cyclic dof factor 1-like n=1 Tax=Phragmites australis TaxID=29695 RepID=UPI002D787913|nr:cyclic dof factor 1-like [Phragmites australis]
MAGTAQQTHRPDCLLTSLHQPAICLVLCYERQQQGDKRSQELLVARERGTEGEDQGGGAEMGECRGGDCLIKLFGMTIPVPEAGDAKDLQHSGSSSSTESDAQENTHQDTSDPSPQPEVVDAEDPKSSLEPQQQPGCDAASQREKLKKPDKVLPCPRCNSMDTKFCYFNNYNVNQPRHFCKNCQRYWTAGGAMRNVPVGAGRRKNKNAVAVSHFLQRVQATLPASDPIKTNGTVLSFGHGAPALDLSEQVAHLKEKLLIPIGSAGNPSTGPCSQGSSNEDYENQGTSKDVTVEKPANGVHHPSMNGAPMWPYSYAPPPAFYSSGIAIPIYPAAPGYWGCMVPGAWSLPWPVQSPTQGLSSPTSALSFSSGPDSLTLGKHPREGDEGRGHGSGKVWAPKTIRIDDVDEVARSSIWSLIRIEGDKKDADTGGHKLGTVFELKGEAKTAKQAMITSSPLLHANPVALTRSVTFHEGS